MVLGLYAKERERVDSRKHLKIQEREGIFGAKQVQEVAVNVLNHRDTNQASLVSFVLSH